MKKKITALAAACLTVAMMLTGCSGEISNDYITISQYKGVEVAAVEMPEVTDEDVEAEIQSVLEAYGETKEITDRPAQLGDTATIDYVGTLNGEAFDGGTAEDYGLELGSGTFIEGFEDGIVGHSIGETFDLNLTFPETYGSAELAGQDVVFTVTLNGISEEILPELTDAWVEEITEGKSKTVEEYRKATKENLENFYKENVQSTLMSEAWDAVMENTTVNSYPKEELQALISMYQETYQSMAEQYEMEFGEFLEAYMGMDEDTFNAEVSTAAKDQLKETMVADLIIEKAKIDVSDEALDKVYEDYVSYYGYDSVEALKEEMEEAGSMEQLENMARVQIVQEWLADNCKQVKAEESESSEK